MQAYCVCMRKWAHAVMESVLQAAPRALHDLRSLEILESRHDAAFYGIGGIVGRLIGGWLLDRYASCPLPALPMCIFTAIVPGTLTPVPNSVRHRPSGRHLYEGHFGEPMPQEILRGAKILGRGR